MPMGVTVPRSSRGGVGSAVLEASCFRQRVSVWFGIQEELCVGSGTPLERRAHLCSVSSKLGSSGTTHYKLSNVNEELMW